MVAWVGVKVSEKGGEGQVRQRRKKGKDRGGRVRHFGGVSGDRLG